MKILIIILIALGVFRLSTWMVYGSLIKDEEWIPILEKQIQKSSELNQFDSNMIYIGNLSYITNIPFDILGYYYISGEGVIPRWSKSHKLIKAEFEKCKQKKLDKWK
jgi:hypothetical protein